VTAGTRTTTGNGFHCFSTLCLVSVASLLVAACSSEHVPEAEAVPGETRVGVSTPADARNPKGDEAMLETGGVAHRCASVPTAG
jgi:hypothetical protein